MLEGRARIIRLAITECDCIEISTHAFRPSVNYGKWGGDMTLQVGYIILLSPTSKVWNLMYRRTSIPTLYDTILGSEKEEGGDS